jgi:hypothetical protein
VSVPATNLINKEKDSKKIEKAPKERIKNKKKSREQEKAASHGLKGLRIANLYLVKTFEVLQPHLFTKKLTQLH